MGAYVLQVPSGQGGHLVSLQELALWEGVTEGQQQKPQAH